MIWLCFIPSLIAGGLICACLRVGHGDSRLSDDAGHNLSDSKHSGGVGTIFHEEVGTK